MIGKNVLQKNISWPFTKAVGLIKPTQSIQHILVTERPKWFVPIAVWSATSIARVLMAAGFQSADSLSHANNVFKFLLPAIAIIFGTLAAWLVESELLHIILLLSGGRTSILQIKAITAFAFIPYIIRDIEQCVYMWVTKTVIVLPGFSAVFNSLDTFWERLLFSLLAQIDIFFVWHISLIMISTKIILSKTKLSTLTSVFISIFITLLLKGLMRLVTG